jgi:2,4-didehydro-3-deoxy-L-rhamnonate hydrolase
MKLLRYGAVGAEKPGALDSEGRIRDLSMLVDDITPKWLSPERLQALNAIDLTKLPIIEAARLGAPVSGIRQFLAIGLNYRQHAVEAGLEIPTEPVVFTKALSSISGPNDNVQMPDGAAALDWEIELGFVIGTEARKVDRNQAISHIAGYCLANDISERDWQFNRNGQWGKGKSFDTFGPIGPWLVTSDELLEPQDIPLELYVNGTLTQKSNTADMIFSVAEIVSYLSQFMTLCPGDLVITGTPQGVGLGMKPPRYLKRGDLLLLKGGLLGSQKQLVV